MIEKSVESRTATSADFVQVRGQARTITLWTVQNGTIGNSSQVTITDVSARAFLESFRF
jgi:hypothetical protein